ncbi:MAG: UvrD-helicase domain-containing protein [Simkaniaceae bacterium]|nr:UvrD-helicase domain-containing protein [Simkaniaceae bacterium]
MSKHLIQLNQEQYRAVTSTEGRILILAGAGSGKTSVLICRMVHLIQNCGIDPTCILGLTFTNKAAGEMKSRMKRFIPAKQAEKIHLCTFHSFCFHLLKKEIHHLGYTDKFSIYDERDIRRLMTQICKQYEKEDEPLPVSEDLMGNVKKVMQGKEVDDKNKTFEAIAKDFKMTLRAYNAVDFDGLIELTAELFKQHPEILAKYQDRYRYIMIDEYQDTNPAQYEIASLLSKHHRNLCVVGDDDQSIYGWRGAEVKHILEFEYDILIKLEQNYRSTRMILDAANQVIRNNQLRHDKTMWCHRSETEMIHIFHAPDEQKEAEGIISRLLILRKDFNMKWKDMAILYRSNILTRPLELALMNTPWKTDTGEFKRGIPYKIAEGSEFYTRAEIKDLFAYLRVIENPQDQEALLRIINYPRRGISTQTIDQLTQYNRKEKIPLWSLLSDLAQEKITLSFLNPRALKAIQTFISLMNDMKTRFETQPLHQSLKDLVDLIQYKQTVKDEVKSEKAAEFRENNVDQLIRLLKDYEESQENASLHDFVHDIILDVKDYKRNHRDNDDRLNLLTFHSAKGLEFDACFILGVEDHLIPHEKSLLQTGVEEERRLLYVAMTRAKQFLTISMSRARTRYGKPQPSNPSRFLFEIPKTLMKTSAWDFPEPYQPISDI